jgi:hypothetical protein
LRLRALYLRYSHMCVISSDIPGSDTHAPPAHSAPHTSQAYQQRSCQATASPDAPGGQASSHGNLPTARSRRESPAAPCRAYARPRGRRSGRTTARPDSSRSTNASCLDPPLPSSRCCARSRAKRLQPRACFMPKQRKGICGHVSPRGTAIL